MDGKNLGQQEDREELGNLGAEIRVRVRYRAVREPREGGIQRIYLRGMKGLGELRGKGDQRTLNDLDMFKKHGNQWDWNMLEELELKREL